MSNRLQEVDVEREREREGGQSKDDHWTEEVRQSGATNDCWSTEADDQLLSVRLTQREQGSAICSKVNGKETRWGGDTAQSGRRTVVFKGGGGWTQAVWRPRTGEIIIR